MISLEFKNRKVPACRQAGKSLKVKNILLIAFFIFTGLACSVRTYTVQKDRVDQDLSVGNRGYAQDRAPAIDESQRSKTRPHAMIEVEIGRPTKLSASSTTTSQTATSNQAPAKIK